VRVPPLVPALPRICAFKEEGKGEKRGERKGGRKRSQCGGAVSTPEEGGGDSPHGAPPASIQRGKKGREGKERKERKKKKLRGALPVSLLGFSTKGRGKKRGEVGGPGCLSTFGPTRKGEKEKGEGEEHPGGVETDPRFMILETFGGKGKRKRKGEGKGTPLCVARR